jgi:membrane protein
MTSIWQLLRRTVSDWIEDKVPQLGAALAFYTALSIAPLLIIALSAAALYFGEEAAHGELSRQVNSLVGAQAGEAIEEIVASGQKPAEGTIAAIMGIVMLLFGASGVFGQLQDSLNAIWEVKPKSNRGVWGMIRHRLFSFAIVLGIGFLLMVSLVISATLAALGTVFDRLPDDLHWLAQGVNLVISLGVFTVLFALMFKYLPDVKIAWSDVWLGAFITALLFLVGKFAIGLYLGHSSMASTYRVAGSFVVLLVWVYYSAQILFLGAEFTQVYANQFGSRIVPNEQTLPLDSDLHERSGRLA